MGLSGLHILRILLEDLAQSSGVEADVAQEMEDIKGNWAQAPQRCIQMVQLQQPYANMCDL